MTHSGFHAPKSLMFYLDRFEIGGVEKVTLNLMEGLLASGWPISLALNQHVGAALPLLPTAVQVHDLAVRSFPKAVVGLARLLRQEQPAVLISQRSYLNVIASLAILPRLGRTRLVLSEHSLLSLAWQTYPETGGPGIRWGLPLAYRAADAVVGVSSAGATDLARVTRLPPAGVRLLYNPVVSDRLVTQSWEPVNPPWPDDGTPVVLAVGRLDHVKRFPLLFEAIARLRSRHPVRLALVGTGPEEAALRRRVEGLGLANTVYFLGFQPNPYAWMRRADVLVLTSLIETFPTVLIEAMAVGTPVVSVDCPHGPSEIITDGENGLLVPVDDPDAIAEALFRVLSDPALATMLRAGGLRRSQDFTVTASVRAYDDLFRGLAGA